MLPNRSRIDSIKKLVGAYKSDPGRMLQRSFCYDHRRNWSVAVSWGFSVELYPTLVTVKQLETTFRTFRTWQTWSMGPYTFSTRPLRDAPCERPLVYFLDRVENVGGKQTRTKYKRHVDSSQNECGWVVYRPALAVQYVDVASSQFTPDMWKKVRNCSNRVMIRTCFGMSRFLWIIKFDLMSYQFYIIIIIYLYIIIQS